MSSLYTFTDYSPDWPAEFERTAAGLQALLGEVLTAVHHIGSTSVPGLAAKPTIDFLPLVRDITEMDALAPVMEQAGYRAWGEYGLPGRRFFTRDRDGFRTHNLHFYQDDDPDVERHLAFCAWLRASAESRRDYEALKRAVYAQHPADIAAYSEGKNAWIKQMERIAVTWYREQAGAANPSC